MGHGRRIAIALQRKSCSRSDEGHVRVVDFGPRQEGQPQDQHVRGRRPEITHAVNDLHRFNHTPAKFTPGQDRTGDLQRVRLTS